MAKKEIVYYYEQHTMMTQDVTVYINENMCKEMLSEDLNEDSKRELFQAYYLNELKENIKIEPKNNYGDWNASIEDISAIKPYLPKIIEVLSGKINQEEVEKNIKLIDSIVGLSSTELEATTPIKQNMHKIFCTKQKKSKLNF